MKVLFNFLKSALVGNTYRHPGNKAHSWEFLSHFLHSTIEVRMVGAVGFWEGLVDGDKLESVGLLVGFFEGFFEGFVEGLEVTSPKLIGARLSPISSGWLPILDKSFSCPNCP